MLDPDAARRSSARWRATDCRRGSLGGEGRADRGRRAAATRTPCWRRSSAPRACAPTLAAARAGKRILLANKEALVIGGAAFMEAVRARRRDAAADRQRAQCDLPVPAGAATRAIRRRSGVRRILLTASGGPFRTRPLAELADVTPDEACAHPNWVMGRKISVDSATMMNKGLEVIEAHWLFGVPPRADRGRRASAKRHPFAGRVRRRIGARPTRPSRHAHADRAGARVSRPHRRRGRRARARRARARSRSRRRISSAFPASASPTTRCARAAPRRRCSTRRTKSRSPRFSPRASATRTSRRRAPRRWRACRRGRCARSTTRWRRMAKPRAVARAWLKLPPRRA